MMGRMFNGLDKHGAIYSAKAVASPTRAAHMGD
jgi:hypothetical protein